MRYYDLLSVGLNALCCLDPVEPIDSEWNTFQVSDASIRVENFERIYDKNGVRVGDAMIAAITWESIVSTRSPMRRVSRAALVIASEGVSIAPSSR